MDYPRQIFKKLIIILGIIFLSLYIFFRIQFINLNPYLAIFSILVFLAELHTVLHLFGMFYNLWPRKYQQWPNLNTNTGLQINMLICVCGEPSDIVSHTVEGAKRAAIAYIEKIKPNSKPRVVILNDGYVAHKENWQEIEILSQKLGVKCLTRRVPGGFKAGNINYALKKLQTKNPRNTIDIVFDSDFAAKDDFLLEITKPFVDPNIDFVQSPQRYQNEQSWVARAAAAHQIFFFDYVCPATGHDNSLFLCGTNFAIRRQALLDVDGIDTRFITEDYATSLNLHLKGKKGVFMPKVLALGLAPESLKAYFSQQQRWSKGNFDVTRAYIKPLLFGNLKLKQKFHYLIAATYYLIGIRDLILMLAPIPYLFWGISPIKPNTTSFLAFIYGPLMIYNFLLFLFLFKEPLKSMVLDLISFPVFAASFFSSLSRKKLGFIVTIKKYEKENVFQVYKIQLVIMIVLLVGLFYSTIHHSLIYLGAFFNYFWATFDAAFLMFGFYLLSQENHNIKRWEKIFIIKPLNFFVQLFKVTGKLTFKPALSLIIIILTTNGSNIYTFIQHDSPNLFLNSQIKQQKLLIPHQGVYYGYYSPDLNSHPSNPQVGILPGEKPSLVMFYQEWGGEHAFNFQFMDSLAKKNVLPIITWEPWDAASTKTITSSIGQIQYAPKIIASGTYDAYIKAWAKAAALYKKPFFIRFGHEMNGNWYPWGNVNDNTPDDYKKMWIHVYNIFQQEHANNVIWIWAPNATDEYGRTDSILDYYPGDDYVDWVGFSGFNWGTSNPGVTHWNSFKELSSDAYIQLSKINKPIMVAETSSASFGGNKTIWFKNTLKNDIPDMPNIKALILFNQDFRVADFSLVKNMDTQSVISNYLINNNYYLKNPGFVN